MQRIPLALAILLGTGAAFGQSPSSPTRPPLTPAAAALPFRPSTPGVPDSAAPPGVIPTVPTSEKLTTFENESLDVRCIDGRWELVAGQEKLKDLGQRKDQAREALQILRELRVNQHGTIGTPEPVLEYWLVDGRAPRTLGNRLRFMPLDPDRLRVDQVHGQWCIRDDRTPLFRFGQHQDDARKALDVIRRYGFTQIGHVGYPTPILLYFAAGPKNPGPGGSLNSPLSGTKAVQNGMGTPLRSSMLSQTGTPPPASLLPVGLQNSGQPPAVRSVLPGVEVLSERVPFDWRQVQLTQTNQEWKLGFGGCTLANFGKDELSARQALAVVQYYHFSEHCLTSGTSSFSYFLCNGQAPRGLPPGVRGEPFRPESLSVQQRAAEYVLCENNRVLLHFGDREIEARQVLQAIKEHKFNHLCRIGSGDPAPLMFFARAN
jgi:hypothetical protein